MRLVVVESPYGAKRWVDRTRNIAYARACVRDCLNRGEAPAAGHVLYTQRGILDDDIPEERAQGIKAHLAWAAVADLTVVYTDRGISPGMTKGIEDAKKNGRPIKCRRLGPEWSV